MTDKNAFLDIIGHNPQAKIFDALITGRRLDYSATGIIRATGIGRATFYRLFPKLLKQALILQTRKIGNIQLYTINQQNPIIQQLIKLHNQVLKSILQKHKTAQVEAIEQAELITA